MRLTRIAVLLTLVLLGSAMPARAADVTVTLHLRILTTFGSYEPAVPGCDVTVVQGADGYALLDAAVAQGCIVSWEIGGSHGVRCINEVCEVLLCPPSATAYTNWSANGAPNSHFGSFSATDGSNLYAVYYPSFGFPQC